jgi:hypothetical protein
MKVFPQPNAPRMEHVRPRAEGNHASSMHCKKKEENKIQSSQSVIRRKRHMKIFCWKTSTFEANDVNNNYSGLEKINRFKNNESTTVVRMVHYQIVSISK